MDRDHKGEYIHAYEDMDVKKEDKRIKKQTTTAEELYDGIGKVGSIFLVGAVGGVIARCINENKKTVPLNELLNCFELARRFSADRKEGD